MEIWRRRFLPHRKDGVFVPKLMKIRFDARSQSDPTRVGGMTVPYAPAKRAFSRWRWYLVLILAASPLLFFVVKSIFSVIFIEAPGVVSLNQVAVNAPSPGIVSKVTVHSGMRVNTGDSIAYLTDPQLVERKTIITNEISTIRQLSGPRQNGALLLAQKIEKRLAEQAAIMRRLMLQGAATRAEVNDIETRHDAALRDLEMARRDNRPVELSSEARARLTALESELQNIRIAEGRLAVTAPAPGAILEVFAAQGESLAQGAPLAVITEEGLVSITAFLPAADIRWIEIGEKASAHFADGTVATLTVVSAASATQRMPSALASSFLSPEQVIPIILTPDVSLPASALRQNMPCTVYFGFRSPL